MAKTTQITLNVTVHDDFEATLAATGRLAELAAHLGENEGLLSTVTINSWEDEPEENVVPIPMLDKWPIYWAEKENAEVAIDRIFTYIELNPTARLSVGTVKNLLRFSTEPVDFEYGWPVPFADLELRPAHEGFTIAFPPIKKF